MKKLSIILAGVFVLFFSACQSQAPFPEIGDAYAITKGPQDHLLANYFGINAWSPDGRYVCVLGVDFTGRLPEVTDSATVALVDLADNNRYIPIAKTVCWNFQEAAMFHWLPWEDGLCAFNDCHNRTKSDYGIYDTRLP